MINLLNIVKQQGDTVSAVELNAIVNQGNLVAEWINNYEATHGSTKSITGAIVLGVADSYEWEGVAIVPEFRVYFNGVLLKANVGYAFDITNNTSISTTTKKGTITIIGLGEYSGTKTVNFIIEGKKFKLSYSTEKGTAPAQTTTYAITDAMLPTLTSEGYEHLGWFTAAVGGTKVVAGTVIDKDTTLYAHWAANTFNVTYSTAHGTVVQPTTKYDKLPTLPEPTEDGYWFIGWFYDENCTQVAHKDDVLTENVTLHAKWINYEVTVELSINNDNPEQIVYSATIKKDETDPNAKLYIKEGEEFVLVESGTKTVTLTEAVEFNHELRYFANGKNLTASVYIKNEVSADTTSLSYSSSAGAVEVKVGTGDYSSTKTSFAFSELTNGTTHTIRDASGNIATTEVTA